MTNIMTSNKLTNRANSRSRRARKLVNIQLAFIQLINFLSIEWKRILVLKIGKEKYQTGT